MAEIVELSVDLCSKSGASIVFNHDFLGEYRVAYLGAELLFG